MSSSIDVTPALSVPLSELAIETSRSSGPGGQHVNKTETRVSVRFDVEGSVALDEAQKAMVRERLASRLTREGVLLVSAQRHRSQSANRELAIGRLVELLQEALTEREPRRVTRVPRGQKSDRRQQKRNRGELKRLRQVPPADDD